MMIDFHVGRAPGALRLPGPRVNRRGFAVLCALLLAACGGTAPAPAPMQPGEAILQVRDTTIRANVIPTRNLGEAMAARYGIPRGDDLVMLMVGVRQGEDGRQVSVPARVTASTTDLRGQRGRVELRELVAGDLVDHVGTFRVSPPETLSFVVEVRREGEPPATLRFSHEF
ncbi:DUF4426 domain-containing protein [Lysobacter sp. GX 14042]|uniref:DUF4426 domain-containing protein n=1 Tax=Lysobacter sp. GX 14042 TaxID=2907155 RepID=UPI001F1C78DE|nr:DUF4426 domain-containing protein [Lysobacter sp. GX 14042]MCE7031880.1 DUF4426 domain-containing protein [Lysobacter sp. GX 14042]